MEHPAGPVVSRAGTNNTLPVGVMPVNGQHIGGLHPPGRAKCKSLLPQYAHRHRPRYIPAWFLPRRTHSFSCAKAHRVWCPPGSSSFFIDQEGVFGLVGTKKVGHPVYKGHLVLFFFLFLLLLGKTHERKQAEQYDQQLSEHYAKNKRKNMGGYFDFPAFYQNSSGQTTLGLRKSR